jgi:hypothetical protein
MPVKFPRPHPQLGVLQLLGIAVGLVLLAALLS